MQAVLRYLLVAIAILGLAGDPIPAQISPGELSSAHAELEGSRHCLACHTASQGVAPDLCFACHTSLRRRVVRDEGLHAGAEFRRCETCHIEHHGRDFDLVFWGDDGRESFDHSRTGFELVGAHRTLACDGCHRSDLLLDPEGLRAGGAEPDSTFLGLGTSCSSCHQDPHAGQFAPATCDSCHAPDTWRPAPGFDHAETGFPLTGLHRDLACTECHSSRLGSGDGVRVVQYRGLAHASCSDCHRDPHQGRFGPSCADCHSTGGWSTVRTGDFDHDRTRFPLRGEHRGLACSACHGGRSATATLSFGRCSDCHRDPHSGQLRDRGDGGACESCHTVEGFSPASFGFEDHQRTSFPLEGAHRAIPCIACHQRITETAIGTTLLGPLSRRQVRPGSRGTLQFDFPSTACRDCHRDPHHGETARAAPEGCSECHSLDSWGLVAFDHGVATGFELVGGHRDVGCLDCHVDGVGPPGEGRYVGFAAIPTECSSCHGDPHRPVSGPVPTRDRDCESCHSIEAWSGVRFDHVMETGFALDGAHSKVACTDCHGVSGELTPRTVRFRPAPPTGCEGCHGVNELTP